MSSIIIVTGLSEFASIPAFDINIGQSANHDFSCLKRTSSTNLDVISIVGHGIRCITL